MRILLLNPPHPAVSSRCHDGRMPPLGLLSIGGPLIDAGCQVRLIDAEIGPLTIAQIVGGVEGWSPDAVLIGHSGSTSAHPIVVTIARAMKRAMPFVPIVYGGVYPTFHAMEILARRPEIDVIVRGEGEATTPLLINALETGAPLSRVHGIAYRDDGAPFSTQPAPLIQDLDAHRVGWELIENWDRYRYWGAGRAAVVQFSRGCPHRCRYCGQRDFWSGWRRRDPLRSAAEIGRLHRVHGVRFVDLADENPTSSRQAWIAFLEALIRENAAVQLVATIRADDIVRDSDVLHLYKKAGFARILMGVESTDPSVLVKINKDASVAKDRKAIELLRRHDILSQVAYVVGFEKETDRTHFAALLRLLRYGPDQINAMHVTPHRWTPFCRANAQRRVVELDQSRWDYRHQVLAGAIPPWRVFLWVKVTEAMVQLRPRVLWRLLACRDPEVRAALRWCFVVGCRAWLHEFRSFVSRSDRPKRHPTLEEFWSPREGHKLRIESAAPYALESSAMQDNQRAVLDARCDARDARHTTQQ